jgi:hypothetical protein
MERNMLVSRNLENGISCYGKNVWREKEGFISSNDA